MTNTQTGDPFAHMRFLTMKDVSALTTYTPQHIYRLEAAGKFPRRVHIGLNRVGWRLNDVERWFAERPVAQPKPLLTEDDADARF